MKRKIAQAFITAALISSMAVSPVFATPSVEDLQNDKRRQRTRWFRSSQS